MKNFFIKNPGIIDFKKNVSNRIRHIRQKHKVQSNVNTTPSKSYYIYNQQKNICMNNTFLTPFPKKPIQYQSYYS
jgi:hypothetical protein